MSQPMRSVDVDELAQLVPLLDELGRTRAPLVLRRAEQAVAILSPVPRPAVRRRARRVLTEDDALFALIGISDSGVPGGFSANKREAYRRLRHT